MAPSKAAVESQTKSNKIGVLLMTYGSPEALDDVAAYLTRVRGGKRPPQPLVDEFRRRYEIIGGSPLMGITQDQAAALVSHLNVKEMAESNGSPQFVYRPYVGMRFYDPLIQDTVKQMEEDAIDRAVGIILSPQYSPVLMEGYLQAVRESEVGFDIIIPETWWQEPLFQQAMAQRVQQALGQVPAEKRGDVPLLLTAHSIPRRVYDNDPGYVDQLKATARAIGELIEHDWDFAYQSAGHTKEEWLRPDLSDVFPTFAAAGHDYVVVAPIQFLADHLEILYDIDVAAREQAERQGLEMIRTESLNTDHTFIQALGCIVRSSLKGSS